MLDSRQNMGELRPLTSSAIQEKKGKCKNMNEKYHIRF